MGQEFHVVRCYSCETFQVHQVKKVKKFVCKLCNAKQSVKKEYGRGSGKDCRLHVQKLNNLRQDLEIVKEHRLLQNSSVDQAWVLEETENEESCYFGSEPEVKYASTQNENYTRASKWDTYLEDTTKEEEEGDGDDDDEHIVYTTAAGSKKRRGSTNQVKRKYHKAIHEYQASNLSPSYIQQSPCEEINHFMTGTGHAWQSGKSKPSSSFSGVGMSISQRNIYDKCSFKSDAEDEHSAVINKNYEHDNPVVPDTMGRMQSHYISYEKPYSACMHSSPSLTRNIHRPGMVSVTESEKKGHIDVLLEDKQKVKERKTVIQNEVGAGAGSRWNKYVVKEESESEEEEENGNSVNDIYVNRDGEADESYKEEVTENGYPLGSVAKEVKEFVKASSPSSEETHKHETYRQSYFCSTDRLHSKLESFSVCSADKQEIERAKRAVEPHPGVFKVKPDRPSQSVIDKNFLNKHLRVESKYLALEDDLQLDI